MAPIDLRDSKLLVLNSCYVAFWFPQFFVSTWVSQLFSPNDILMSIMWIMVVWISEFSPRTQLDITHIQEEYGSIWSQYRLAVSIPSLGDELQPEAERHQQQDQLYKSKWDFLDYFFFFYILSADLSHPFKRENLQNQWMTNTFLPIYYFMFFLNKLYFLSTTLLNVTSWAVFCSLNKSNAWAHIVNAEKSPLAGALTACPLM